MKFVIPIKTVSTANERGLGWRPKAKRVRNEREVTHLAFKSARVKQQVPALPLVVWLTRVSPGELDSDNLPPSMKAIRDQLADELGLPNDRDPRVTWAYDQHRGREASVIVVMEAAVQTSAPPADPKKVIKLVSAQSALPSEKPTSEKGKSEKPGRGGRREGAGRPVGREMVTVKRDPELVAVAARLAEASPLANADAKNILAEMTVEAVENIRELATARTERVLREEEAKLGPQYQNAVRKNLAMLQVIAKDEEDPLDAFRRGRESDEDDDEETPPPGPSVDREDLLSRD